VKDCMEGKREHTKDLKREKRRTGQKGGGGKLEALKLKRGPSLFLSKRTAKIHGGQSRKSLLDFQGNGENKILMIP